ncbi:MAG: NAD(P)/FAD-dependent oxidoreductase [Dehalococcoidia bacterium]
MRYLIIGNSAAGNAAAEAIRSCDPGGEITIISDEAEPAYYRPLIPLLIDGERDRESLFRDELHTPQGVEVKLGQRATAIDARYSTVTLASGEQMGYDKLLLATGASPARPPIMGLEGPGAYYLRRMEDAQAIRAASRGAKRAVIIGGGRIGTKAALALRRCRLEVAIVEMLPRIVPLQLDDAAAQILEEAIRAQGIEVILGQEVREVTRKPGPGREVSGVVLGDGRRLDTDLVVAAVGVVANTELARGAGAYVGRGVSVDQYLSASLHDIYAAGDVAEIRDVVSGQIIVSGIWTNAVEMGRAAGENMAGGRRVYAGGFGLLNAMELAGVPVISVGIIEPPAGDGYEVHTSRRGENYRKLVFRDDVLKGALLVGEIEGAGVLATLIREKTPLGSLKAETIKPRFGYAHYVTTQAPVLDTYVT